eukprot:2222541-Prymnesium_polylepis.1
MKPGRDRCDFSRFYDFHAYRVGNTLDRKLASGDPYSGKLQLCRKARVAPATATRRTIGHTRLGH